MPTAKLATTDVQSEQVFDARPIRLEGFTLRARSVQVDGSPGFNHWLRAMQFAHATAEAAPYWWGDLMRYAETRDEWKDLLAQAMEITGLARQTLLNYTSVCNRVEEPERQLAPTIGHAEAVAPLPRPAQTRFLKAARAKDWSVRELKQAVRAAARSKILEGQADTLHAIDVTVTVTVEAASGNLAEQLAWSAVQAALKASPPAGTGIGKSRVIAAHEKGGS